MRDKEDKQMGRYRIQQKNKNKNNNGQAKEQRTEITEGTDHIHKPIMQIFIEETS